MLHVSFALLYPYICPDSQYFYSGFPHYHPIPLIPTLIPYILPFSTFPPVSSHPQSHSMYSSHSHFDFPHSQSYSPISLISTLITRISFIPTLIPRIPTPFLCILLFLTLIPGIRTLFPPQSPHSIPRFPIPAFTDSQKYWKIAKKNRARFRTLKREISIIFLYHDS